MRPAKPNGKIGAPLPTARTIRRACNNELYRTMKRLKLWVSPDKLAAAEKLYFEKVILNLQWVADNHSNRQLLSDWWDENVSEAIAELWEVDRHQLCQAFRSAFGG